jgi:hypothetical protein
VRDRGYVSVCATTGERFSRRCAELGRTMGQVLEALLADVLGETPAPVTERPGLRRVEIPVSLGVWELVDDYVTRQRELYGKEIAPCDAFEGALVALLDALESGESRLEPDNPLPPARPIERGYEPNGGLPTHKQALEACRNDPGYQRAAQLDEAWARSPGKPGEPVPDRISPPRGRTIPARKIARRRS